MKREIDYLDTKCKCGHYGVQHKESCKGECYFNDPFWEGKSPWVKRRCNCKKFRAKKPIYYHKKVSQ